MNPSIAERESCPDCLVLERENEELRKRIKELETHQPEAERALPKPTPVHSTVDD